MELNFTDVFIKKVNSIKKVNDDEVSEAGWW